MKLRAVPPTGRTAAPTAPARLLPTTRTSALTPPATAVFAGLDGEEFPRLAEAGGRWEELTARDTYEKGLCALVADFLP
ncbi:hypothetical protein [Streptomyces sp. NPDC017868]|uniref:hypothetical protein n=1 Tax=Streptomyces sp. NPDC017868 TaxID=3365014 RepID=UPI0037AE53F2